MEVNWFDRNAFNINMQLNLMDETYNYAVHIFGLTFEDLLMKY